MPALLNTIITYLLSPAEPTWLSDSDKVEEMIEGFAHQRSVSV
jgi:hypothetical protein